MAIRATPSGPSVQGTSKGHYDIGPSGRRVFHTEGWWNLLNNRSVPTAPATLSAQAGQSNPNQQGDSAKQRALQQAVLNQYVGKKPRAKGRVPTLKGTFPKPRTVAGGVMAPPGVTQGGRGY